MFCNKCGAHLDDNAKFCNKCGNVLVEDNQNGVDTNKTIQNIAISEKNNHKNIVNKSYKSFGKNNKLIIIVGVIILLLATTCYGISKMPKSISLFEELEVEFVGYDGFGIAKKNDDFFDTGFFYEIENQLNEYSTKLSNPFGLKEKEILKIKRKMMDLEMFNRSLECGFNVNGNLKNGDEVQFVCLYDEELMKRLGYKFKEDSKTFVVEGLEEVQEYDVFKDVTVKWENSGYSGLKVVLSYPKESEYGLHFTVDSVSDDGVVKVYLNNTIDSLGSRGIVPMKNEAVKEENGRLYKEISIGKRPVKVQTRVSEINDDNFYDEKICMIREKSDKWIWETLEKFNYTLYPSWRGDAITVNEYKLYSISDDYATYYLKCSDGKTYYMKIKYDICLYEDGTYEDLTTESDHQYSGKYSGTSVY